ncbi:MAG: DUF2237 domain-containing protein [Leptospirales bacterium]
MAKNVLGSNLEMCCEDPVTGFYRNGKCDTSAEDQGMHSVCVEITDEFLAFSKSTGNDLSTAQKTSGFKGLKKGDRWCICLSRWMEAHEAGKAPNIYLKSTHISTIEFIDREVLNKYALDATM